MREDRAKELFIEGYNCAQAVTCAFNDLLGVDIDTAAKMASGFGGGMGHMRDVCGAVSGMVLTLGCLSGYSSPTDYEGKKQEYATIRGLINEFRQENGSHICRELLGLRAGEDVDTLPAVRTPKYYANRKCIDCVQSAARILEYHLSTIVPQTCDSDMTVSDTLIINSEDIDGNGHI